MKKYCFALDLIDDKDLIDAYKKYHENIWSEITKSLLNSGIIGLEIYHVGDRLFMIMIVTEAFSFDKKNSMDINNPKVQEWENLMWKYQKKLPFSKDGEKWVMMERIYKL